MAFVRHLYLGTLSGTFRSCKGPLAHIHAMGCSLGPFSAPVQVWGTAAAAAAWQQRVCAQGGVGGCCLCGVVHSTIGVSILSERMAQSEHSGCWTPTANSMWRLLLLLGVAHTGGTMLSSSPQSAAAPCSCIVLRMIATNVVWLVCNGHPRQRGGPDVPHW